MSESSSVPSSSTTPLQLKASPPHANDYKKGSFADKVRHRLSQSSLSLYIGSSMAGMVRTVLGFPIEHPIDSIKTQWQAKPYIKNELEIVRLIYG